MKFRLKSILDKKKSGSFFRYACDLSIAKIIDINLEEKFNAVVCFMICLKWILSNS